ncbi:rho GDP-dissociation inhibitor 3 isoform X1 [Mycteria americana]|uniref:rho GDP-dissociation inhibitor 3 isoform X1 n=1 Tax=Mycteria americana TaxID=33587 RepID=UPI003F582CC1
MSGGAGAARRRGAGAGGGGQRSRRVCGSRRRRRPAGPRRAAPGSAAGGGGSAGGSGGGAAGTAERGGGSGREERRPRAPAEPPTAAEPRPGPRQRPPRPAPGGAGPGPAMLGLDVCEAGGQLLELLWLALCYRDIMADKEGVTLSLEEEEDADVALAYRTPEKKSLREIQELDPGDESLRKYKQALLGAIPAAVGTDTRDQEIHWDDGDGASSSGAWGGTAAGAQAVPPAPRDAHSGRPSLALPSVSAGPGPGWGAPRAQHPGVLADGCMTAGGGEVCKLVRRQRAQRAGDEAHPDVRAGTGAHHHGLDRRPGGAAGPGLRAEGGGGLQGEGVLQGEQGDRLRAAVPAPHLPPGPARGPRRLHGGQLRAAGRGVRGGDAGGGGTAGLAGTGLLPRPLLRHRR